MILLNRPQRHSQLSFLSKIIAAVCSSQNALQLIVLLHQIDFKIDLKKVLGYIGNFYIFASLLKSGAK